MYIRGLNESIYFVPLTPLHPWRLARYPHLPQTQLTTEGRVPERERERERESARETEREKERYRGTSLTRKRHPIRPYRSDSHIRTPKKDTPENEMWTSIISRPHTIPDFCGRKYFTPAHTGFVDVDTAFFLDLRTLVQRNFWICGP
jgi:hypothetical protein